MRITVWFPLGVYHAQSQASFDEPEWPPHPVRLIGALTAAAHSPGRVDSDGGRLDHDLALLRKLCDAPPPAIAAPRAVTIGDASTDCDAVMVAGASRWAPRNYFSPKGREQARVQKVGVAVGDRRVEFDWPTFELDPNELQRLSALVDDVSFLGTTRSPVVASVSAVSSGDLGPAWKPVRANASQRASVAVRVPDPTTLDAFNRRHDARRSSKTGLEAATAAVPGIRIGREVAYVHSSTEPDLMRAVDPNWWGDMIVLAIDKGKSEVVPRAAASYLFARAVRTALLSAYTEAGGPGEAPAILRARGAEAHCAIVPLSDVWHERAGGQIKGVGIVLPSSARASDVALQRSEVERGLASLVGDTGGAPQRYVQIPEAGRIWLKLPDPGEAALKTLLTRTYRATAASWVSVTPVIHARWRKGDRETLIDQVALDCSHAGLPRPTHVEALRGSALPGAPGRPVPIERVPEPWRKSLGGPTSHLRITFASPVAGPVLLGRARHFGLGLFVPDLDGSRSLSSLGRSKAP